MSDNVIMFTGQSYLDLNPDMVLEEAKGELSEVIVLGFTKDGGEYLSGSHASGPNALWLLERLKLHLLSGGDHE